jgi:F-type H+-transporting ATPase subunit b
VIDINIAFVVQIVNILLLMVILNFFLYRPIRKVLSERNAELAGAREKTAAVDNEVQEKMALYESRLREVKSKASDEKGAMLKVARQEEAAILDKARGEATDSLNAIKNKVAKEGADARLMLKEQALSLSREISEKVLGRSL